LILTKITLQDFGLFYGRQTAEVGVEPSGGRNLVVIGGLNGSGKTTLLTGLVFAMLGQEEAFLYFRGLSRKGRDLARRQEELASFLNHQAFREGRRTAAVLLELRDQGRLLAVERRWSFDDRRRFTGETLEVLRDGWPLIAAGDEQLQDVYRDYLENHFPPRIVPFFFFDGEKIQQIAEEDEFLVQLALRAERGAKMTKRTVASCSQNSNVGLGGVAFGGGESLAMLPEFSLVSLIVVRTPLLLAGHLPKLMSAPSAFLARITFDLARSSRWESPMFSP
jgi:hypothetical protein